MLVTAICRKLDLLLCEIADAIVEVPAAGDLGSRCEAYLCDAEVGADIVIRTDSFRSDAWDGLAGNDYIYMESGAHFYFQLLSHDGLMLHSSAVALDGRAYLFSGPCGTGKSTHTRFWQAEFGGKAVVFNDDKPALRRIDDRWIAYGTPWCGKDGINVNMSAPIAGICFLKQADQNRIRRLSEQEAAQKVIWQTMRRFKLEEKLDLMLSHVDKLVREVPIFELENRPEPAAAHLSYETMLRAAEEAGL